MFSSLSWQLFYAVLFLSFLNASDLAKTFFIKFFFGYLKYLVQFSIKLSYFYLKFIGVFLIWYKAFFFTNLIPSFIQLVFSFHFLFNYFWDLYLLLIIYSSIFFCLPVCGFIYTKRKNICVQIELKILILLNFILFFNFEVVFFTFINLICIDKLLLNRKKFLSKNEFNMETKTFTEKSLNELQLHVLENYDKTLRSVNKKQKYAQLSLKFSFLSEFF